MEARENVSLYCSKLEGKKKETVFEGAGLIVSPRPLPFNVLTYFPFLFPLLLDWVTMTILHFYSKSDFVHWLSRISGFKCCLFRQRKS